MLALVAALGGGAVAGVTISKLNNKEKKQVKKISKKQAKKQVKGIPVGPEGPAGPQGQTGPQGPKGDPAGTSAVARFQTSDPAPTPPMVTAQATSLCEAGEVSVGGGGAFVLGTDAISDQMSFSVPTSSVPNSQPRTSSSRPSTYTL